jgi:hypothetical protein
MLYLLEDSEDMLQQIENPVSDRIEIYDNKEIKNALDKSKAKRRTVDNRFAATNEGFKINPKHFEWFIAGIDAEKLRKIMVEGDDRVA